MQRMPCLPLSGRKNVCVCIVTVDEVQRLSAIRPRRMIEVDEVIHVEKYLRGSKCSNATGHTPFHNPLCE